MNKHAYLIMAHNNFHVMKRCMQILDSTRNDFYIHVDKKANNFDENEIKTCVSKSKVHFIERQNVYWADYSQVRTELNLLDAAYYSGEKYTFFHLLSGSDMPVKTEKEIYNFFETNRDKNFIGIVPNESYYSVRRVKYYHLLLHNSIYRKCKVLKAMDRFLEYIQKLIRINRIKNRCWKFYDGWTWFSITSEFAKYVLNKKDTIRKIFQYSIASDELVMQTLGYNDIHFRKTFFDTENLKRGSMRYIDWNRGRPYTWGRADYEELINCPMMFARKFDEEYNMEIIEKLYHQLKKEY